MATVSGRALGAALAFVVLVGCGQPAHPARPEPATRSTPSTAAPTIAPTTAAASGPVCSNASEVRSWPLARRAALLLVAPVFNFDLTTARLAADAGAGGILFLGGAPPPAGLETNLKTALSQGAGPAPLVMADEEGGGIQRLAGPVMSLPWPRTMAATFGTDRVKSLAAQVGGQMRSLGVTVDLAPVADVDSGVGPSAANPDGLRSFSGDPSVASRYAVAFMDGLTEGGVIPVVKHFPGLGGAGANTDFGPALTLPIATLRAGGLIPFRAAIEAGAPAVMVSNAAVPGLSSVPASVSPAVITGLLRNELGFTGLVVTDSLSAVALTAAGYNLQKAAVAAIGAGADMVLFGSTLTPADAGGLTPANVQATVGALTSSITAAVSSGTIAEGRVDDAAVHILDAEHANLCRA